MDRNGNMVSLGIAGTAKNTGKTTTLQTIILMAQRDNIRVAVTSIGYDGEWKDNITGLLKPRIHVLEGMLVGIASQALAASTCKIKLIQKTGILTALGEIMVGQVTEPGLLITAGPNKVSDLNVLQDILNDLGCSILLVDGALNRIIPFMLTDAIILATGAARSQNIEILAKDTALFEKLFQFRFVQSEFDSPSQQTMTLKSLSGSFHSWPFGSLMTEDLVKDIIEKIHHERFDLFIPGAVEAESLYNLVNALIYKNIFGQIHLKTALQLIPGNDLKVILSALGRWEHAGGHWGAQKVIPLLAVTVNPFYPAFRVAGSSYSTGYVQSDDLLRAVKKSVSVPAYDSVKDGGVDLWKRVRGYFHLN